MEVGYDEMSRSFVRALDIGAIVREGAPSYPSLDDALRALDVALGEWLQAPGRQWLKRAALGCFSTGSTVFGTQ
jgi:hypothetical protein